MRRNPRRTVGASAGHGVPLAVVGVVALVVLAACSGGDDAGSAALDTARPTTTVAAEGPTTTAAPASPTTRAPVTTTPPRPAPEYMNGIPQVKAVPARGAVGARIRIDGYGFTEQQWQAPGAFLWVVGSAPGCALYAQADHTVRVGSDGHLTGDFVIPARGECRQSSVGEVPVTAGRYTIVYSCTPCRIGELEVTAPPAPVPTPCNDVVFTPNSENGASSIVATGISCADAEAFVRKVGGPLGPINGLPHTEADGFVCERTSQEDRGLPSATYRCTRGAQLITFLRT